MDMKRFFLYAIAIAASWRWPGAVAVDPGRVADNGDTDNGACGHAASSGGTDQSRKSSSSGAGTRLSAAEFRSHKPAMDRGGKAPEGLCAISVRTWFWVPRCRNERTSAVLGAQTKAKPCPLSCHSRPDRRMTDLMYSGL